MNQVCWSPASFCSGEKMSLCGLQLCKQSTLKNSDIYFFKSWCVHLCVWRVDSEMIRQIAFLLQAQLQLTVKCLASHTSRMWWHLFSSPRWMYWTDWEEDPTESNRGKIKKAWMDGSNHQVLLTSKTVLWPNGLSLDIPQGILYWVDAYYDRIELVYLNTTDRKVGDAHTVFK